WAFGAIPFQWAESLIDSTLKAKPGAATPEQVAVLADAVVAFGNYGQNWAGDLLLRQAQVGQHFEFADTLNRFTARQNPNQAQLVTSNYLPWSQELTTMNKPELA